MFLFWLVVLSTEGYLFATCVLGKTHKTLHTALALPLASLLNFFLLYKYAVLGITLRFIPFLLGHILIIGLLLCFIQYQKRFLQNGPSPIIATTSPWIAPTWIRGCCIILLSISFIFSAAHTFFIPTVQFDSFTNWTMRSRISYEDQAMAFDTTEQRGMAKPQYPFLMHGLQILVQQGSHSWSDRAGNIIIYFLILSGLTCIFLLIRLLRGTSTALVTITILTGIPLLHMHLIPGYGDIPLLLWLCIGLISMALYADNHNVRWLILSGLCVIMGCFTKLEGLQTGVLPFLLLLVLFMKQRPVERIRIAIVGAGSIVLAALFPIFLLSKGLPLSPHGTDFALEVSTKAIALIPSAMFASGSFGIIWYAILLMLAFIGFAWKKHFAALDRRKLWTLTWGLFVSAEFVFLYTCTSNAQFLINQESFFRQMLIPAALLIVGFAVVLKKPTSS